MKKFIGLSLTEHYRKKHRKFLRTFVASEIISCRNSMRGYDAYSYSIRVLASNSINIKQVLAARRVMMRKNQKELKIYYCVFPHIMLTSKPKEVRMGKGKGAFKSWLFNVKAGQILFESIGSRNKSPFIIYDALMCLRYKLTVGVVIL